MVPHPASSESSELLDEVPRLHLSVTSGSARNRLPAAERSPQPIRDFSLAARVTVQVTMKTPVLVWRSAILALSLAVPSPATAQTCGLLTNSGFESDLAGFRPARAPGKQA